MATLQQFRQGLESAWSNVVEGWRRLTERASSALTRFNLPGQRGGEENQVELAAQRRNLGWGLLAAEVLDDDRRVLVRLEAPGMQKDDFDIRVIDDFLVVRGQKKLERETTEGHYHIVECAYGNFERAIPLPCDVDQDRAAATYSRGVLTIELPKPAKDTSGPRSIPISSD